MINLTGKDLSGLARGVEIFKSVKRASERLNDDGFLTTSGMVEAKNRRDEFGSVCDGCNLTSDQAELKKVKGHLFCKECAARNEVSTDDWNSKKPVKNSEYPHDILPNKKDGLKRGVTKYGKEEEK